MKIPEESTKWGIRQGGVEGGQTEESHESGNEVIRRKMTR